MTVKEYLHQAYRLDHRIDSDIAEMERLRGMACSVSSPGFEEHYNPNRPTDAPYVRSLEKVWELQKKVDDEIDRLVDLKEQMRGVIGAVPDIDEQLVLRYRYLDDCTWEEISRMLNVSLRTVHRIHGSALQNFSVPD